MCALKLRFKSATIRAVWRGFGGHSAREHARFDIVVSDDLHAFIAILVHVPMFITDSKLCNQQGGCLFLITGCLGNVKLTTRGGASLRPPHHRIL